MSSIKMCDFCGTITGGDMAEVLIRLPNRDVMRYARATGNDRYVREMQDALVKDACQKCTANLLVVPVPQAISTHPFKDDEVPTKETPSA